jgi:hypothetical protein
MRVSFAALIALVLAVVIAGCSSGPAGSSTPGVTLAPGATPAPTQAPGPTQTPPPVDVGQVCGATPTYSVDAPTPSFAQDETLNARFPTQVDGQPVTGVNSGFWLQSMCYYGSSSEALARFIAIWPPNTAQLISTGYAHVELDGESVSIQALRVPNSDPTIIFSHIPEFIEALGGDPADAANTTVTTKNIGGKNVYVVDDDGDLSYDYVSGDTIWSISDSEDVAAKVFAAIQ